MLPSGALLVDKPEGLTSSQVVSKIKWALTNFGYAAKGFKIGHGGTLDPFAVGTLIIFLGEGTKLADTYLHSKKAYDGVITLGASTDTGDLTGTENGEASLPSIHESEWQKLADVFTSEKYLQIPHMFSAKKRDGTPLYELARAGISIEREPIEKKISVFKIQKTDLAHELTFEVHCESGTYVRVLAEDLAKKAGTLAHLKTLRRIQSSDASISECVTLEKTLEAIENKSPLEEMKNFRPLSSLASHIPSISIDSNSSNLLWNGVQEEAERIGQRCSLEFPNQSLVIARNDRIPIALFENFKNLQSFRLQRIFNEGRRS